MCLMCGCSPCCCKDERDSYERRQDQEDIGVPSLPRTEYIPPNEDKLCGYVRSFSNLDVLRAARKDEGDYTAYFDDTERYVFLQKHVVNIGDHPEKITGWKIHVSLNPIKIGQAWDIIMPVLIKYGIQMFKAAKPICYSDYIKENFQAGKEIVIYGASSRDDVNWSQILERIQLELIKARVEASDNPKFRQSSDNVIGPPEPEIIINENQLGYFYLSDDSKNIHEFTNWISGLSINNKGNYFLQADRLVSFINCGPGEASRPASFQMH